MRFSFASIGAFRAADPRRLASREVDLGGPWRTAGAGPAYRAAWLPSTGELYLVRLGSLPTGSARVELLAQVLDRAALTQMLAGWRDAVGGFDSVRWLRARVARAHPLKARAAWRAAAA